MLRRVQNLAVVDDIVDVEFDSVNDSDPNNPIVSFSLETNNPCSVIATFGEQELDLGILNEGEHSISLNVGSLPPANHSLSLEASSTETDAADTELAFFDNRFFSNQTVSGSWLVVVLVENIGTRGIFPSLSACVQRWQWSIEGANYDRKIQDFEFGFCSTLQNSEGLHLAFASLLFDRFSENGRLSLSESKDPTLCNGDNWGTSFVGQRVVFGKAGLSAVTANLSGTTQGQPWLTTQFLGLKMVIE